MTSITLQHGLISYALTNVNYTDLDFNNVLYRINID